MFHLPSHILFHHYNWKDVKLSELSELYISMMIRTLGLSLIGIFVPVYLYQIDYTISQIASFFITHYAFRIPSDLVVAKIVGRFGPKHTMIMSHFFLLFSLAQLLSLETIQWPLWSIAIINGFAYGLFFSAYHIEFSKIQTARSAGKEIGIMYQIGKLASALGPLVGGIAAQVLGIQFVFGAAMVLIISSAIPLAFSPEPVRKHQHVTFKGFPWKKVKWDLISNSGLGFDQMTSLLVWPLYVSVFVFTENIYVSIGLVTSIGLASAFIFAGAFGKLIDKNKGNQLLNYGIAGSSIMHLIRVLVHSSGAVYIFNIFSEPIQIAVRMPYTKGLYGAASSHEGYRDAYIAIILTTSNIMRVLAWIIVYFVASSGQEKLSLQVIFVLSAITIWLVPFHRYKALQ